MFENPSVFTGCFGLIPINALHKLNKRPQLAPFTEQILKSVQLGKFTSFDLSAISLLDEQFLLVIVLRRT